MKKARTTSARAKARKSASKAQSAPPAQPAQASKSAAPPAVPDDKTATAAPIKLKHGLGSLGLKSLDRPEIVPSLVLIPAARTAQGPVAPASTTSPPASKKRAAAPAGEAGKSSEHADSALVLNLRDELRSLLVLLDEAPPSL